MRTASGKHLARSGAAILVLLVVICHATAGAAHAACGHLVSSKVDHSLNWNLDRLITGEPSSLASADQFDPSKLPARRPCSGLSCSGQAPVSSSNVSQTTGGPDHWGALTAVLINQDIDLADATVHAASPHSLSGRPAIFHPPPI
jgi:hypothetical protein